jgi:hypothetical protein
MESPSLGNTIDGPTSQVSTQGQSNIGKTRGGSGKRDSAIKEISLPHELSALFKHQTDGVPPTVM